MNKKFIWLIMSCLMVAALVLASCAPAVVEKKEATVVTKEPEKKAEKVEEVVEEKTKYGGIITILSSNEPLSFDPLDTVSVTPFYNSFTHDSLLVADWYADRALYPYSANNDYLSASNLWVGHLLESWERTDNLTIIFKLRKGILWQNEPPVNGREFEASDVVWTFERLMADPTYANYQYTVYIESITAPDKYTVVVKTKEPFVEMIQMAIADYSYITAREVVEQDGDHREWRHQVGTGPFILEDYVKASSLTYSRNPVYFAKDKEGNRLPYVDGVKILLIEDSATQVAALRTNKVDLLNPWDSVGWEIKPSLESTNPELQWGESLAGAIWYLYLRNNIKPFSDIKVRQALSMGINRQEMVDSIFGGNAVAFAAPARPGWPSFVPLDKLPKDIAELYNYNPTRAKELLAEADYPNGFDISVQYYASGNWEAYGTAMELIKHYWKEIGVNLDLVVIDEGKMRAIKKSRDYEHIFAAGTGHTMPVQFARETYYSTHRKNRGWVNDPLADDLTDEASVTFDLAKQNEILNELYLHLLEQSYGIPLPTSSTYAAWHPWVKGYQGECGISKQGMGQVIARIWLDLDLRKEMTGK